MDKKIYRSRNDKMMGGVCGGIAEYFNIDSTVVRLLAVLLFFAEGIGFFLYFISWVIIPEAAYPDSNTFNDSDKDNDQREDKDFSSTDFGKADSSNGSGKTDSSNGSKLIGIGLIAIGLLLLVDKWVPYFHWRRFWPLILVGFGAVLVLKGVKDNE